jgi:hypothetical protein
MTNIFILIFNLSWWRYNAQSVASKYKTWVEVFATVKHSGLLYHIFYIIRGKYFKVRFNQF